MSNHSWQKVLFGLSFAAPVLLNQYPPTHELGAKERRIVGCFSISPPYYHIVSLVSHSNRSGLRSPVQAGIWVRVSPHAHHSSALCQSPSPLAHRPLPARLRFPSHPLMPSLLCTAPAGPNLLHPLRPVPTIVFMHCATPSGTLHC